MMRLIPGTTVTLVEQCSGHDGTWAMKKEFFPLSMLVGKKAFAEMVEAPSDVMASDCPLASIHIGQATGTRPIHPIQILARAYRPDGFPPSYMRPIQLSEIKNIAEYEIEREALRPRMIALKDRRRIAVGDHLTLLFENRETVRYQIQEMMRIERMVKPEEIRHEVETYNELIPPPGGLSASLLIEYATAGERDVKLRELVDSRAWDCRQTVNLAPEAVSQTRDLSACNHIAPSYQHDVQFLEPLRLMTWICSSRPFSVRNQHCMSRPVSGAAQNG